MPICNSSLLAVSSHSFSMSLESADGLDSGQHILPLGSFGPPPKNIRATKTCFASLNTASWGGGDTSVGRRVVLAYSNTLQPSRYSQWLDRLFVCCKSSTSSISFGRFCTGGAVGRLSIPGFGVVLILSLESRIILACPDELLARPDELLTHPD